MSTTENGTRRKSHPNIVPAHYQHFMTTTALKSDAYRAMQLLDIAFVEIVEELPVL